MIVIGLAAVIAFVAACFPVGSAFYPGPYAFYSHYGFAIAVGIGGLAALGVASYLFYLVIRRDLRSVPKKETPQ